MRTRTNPKEILLEEFMKPLEVSVDDLISKLPFTHRFSMYNYMIFEKARINKPVAESLSCVFGTSKEFWLNLQKNYDESRGE